jgi:hypothetical protein
VQVIETTKRVLGEEHPDTLTSMANLALTYSDQGRWTEAEELQVQVIEMRKRVLGAEHPDTLTSMANLASTYRNQGRWKEAEQLQMQAVKGMIKILGMEHPHTLSTITILEQMRYNRDRPAVGKESPDLQQVTPGTGMDKVVLPISVRSAGAGGQGSMQKLKKWWQKFRKNTQ